MVVMQMVVVGMEEEEGVVVLEEVADSKVEVGVVVDYSREGEVGNHCGYLRDL